MNPEAPEGVTERPEDTEERKEAQGPEEAEKTEQPAAPEKPQEPQNTMINRGAAAAFSTAAAIAATAPNAATASTATAATILNPRFVLEARTSTSKLQLPTHTPNVRRDSSKTNNSWNQRSNFNLEIVPEATHKSMPPGGADKMGKLGLLECSFLSCSECLFQCQEPAGTSPPPANMCS